MTICVKQVAATPDLMLAHLDFFLGGDEKRSDLPPPVHQRLPMPLIFGGDGSYMAYYSLQSDDILTSLLSQVCFLFHKDWSMWRGLLLASHVWFIANDCNIVMSIPFYSWSHQPLGTALSLVWTLSCVWFSKGNWGPRFALLWDGLKLMETQLWKDMVYVST